MILTEHIISKLILDNRILQLWNASEGLNFNARETVRIVRATLKSWNSSGFYELQIFSEAVTGWLAPRPPGPGPGSGSGPGHQAV